MGAMSGLCIQMMENHMGKRMEHGMEAEDVEWLKRSWACRD